VTCGNSARQFPLFPLVSTAVCTGCAPLDQIRDPASGITRAATPFGVAALVVGLSRCITG
jgi:hypothetical protein